MGMVAILFNLNKLMIPLQQKATCEIWWKLVKLFQRRHLKITWFYTCIYKCSPRTRADNPGGTKFWLYLEGFATLIIHYKFHPLVLNILWENDFSIFPPYKCTGTQIQPCHKEDVNLGSSFEQIWETLSPWCYILRFSLKVFLILEKKRFKSFYHTWARWPSYLIDCDHLYKFLQSSLDRRPHMKFEENWPRHFRWERRGTGSDHNSSSWAFGSGELKMGKPNSGYLMHSMLG